MSQKVFIGNTPCQATKPRSINYGTTTVAQAVKSLQEKGAKRPVSREEMKGNAKPQFPTGNSGMERGRQLTAFKDDLGFYVYFSFHPGAGWVKEKVHGSEPVGKTDRVLCVEKASSHSKRQRARNQRKRAQPHQQACCYR